MDPARIVRLLLDPAATATAGGGAPPPAAAPAEPTLDSTAGLSRADLAARPGLDGTSHDAVSGEGGGGGPGAAAPPPSPADPNLAAAAGSGQSPPGAPATAQAGAPATIRDAARLYGLDLSSYQDDSQAFAHLVQAALRSRQDDYYTQLGRQLAPHYQDVQGYLRQQQAQQPPPAARPAWEHPEFDERWLALVDRDPQTGAWTAKPGTNPAFAEKVQQYADSVDRWNTMLSRDPQQALGGLIERVAQQVIERRFGQHQQQTEAQAIIASNESWLYQADAQGRRLVGQDGRFVPTPLGARYYAHLQSLRQAGVGDGRTLDALAKQLIQGELYAAARGQQAPAAAAATPAPGHPQVNPLQAVEAHRAAAIPGATEPSSDGLSLADLLRRNFQRDGVSDADFQQLT